MVDCKKINSMYILSKNDNDKFYEKIHKFGDVAKLEKKVLQKAKSLNIKFGQGLIFSIQCCMGISLTEKKILG